MNKLTEFGVRSSENKRVSLEIYVTLKWFRTLQPSVALLTDLEITISINQWLWCLAQYAKSFLRLPTFSLWFRRRAKLVCFCHIFQLHTRLWLDGRHTARLASATPAIDKPRTDRVSRHHIRDVTALQNPAIRDRAWRRRVSLHYARWSTVLMKSAGQRAGWGRPLRALFVAREIGWWFAGVREASGVRSRCAIYHGVLSG